MYSTGMTRAHEEREQKTASEGAAPQNQLDRVGTLIAGAAGLTANLVQNHRSF